MLRPEHSARHSRPSRQDETATLIRDQRCNGVSRILMRTIELFDRRHAIATPSRTAALDTPLGAIDLVLATEGATVGGVAPSSYVVARDVGILLWETSLLRAELLLAPIVADVPKYMKIDGGQTAVWRIRAAVALRTITFEARWRGGNAPLDGGPSSGQGLVALTWHHEHLELSLGAPDAETLAGQERAGMQMPRAWHALIDTNDPSAVVIEEYLRDGFRLQLPALEAGEVAQLHFAVAWADAANQSDAPWFAVNLSPARLTQITESAV